MSNLKELHDLLDGVRDGQHCKAVYRHDEYTCTIEGPASLARGRDLMHLHSWHLRCDGKIPPSLIAFAFEATTATVVTVTRDDGEDALREAIASLTDGQMVTVEWRDDETWDKTHGPLGIDGKYVWVKALGGNVYLCLNGGRLHDRLHSITFTRDEVRRWERDGDE